MGLELSTLSETVALSYLPSCPLNTEFHPRPPGYNAQGARAIGAKPPLGSHSLRPVVFLPFGSVAKRTLQQVGMENVVYSVAYEGKRTLGPVH